MLPLKEFEITERVDELLRAQRSVEVILTKNANKHSVEFIEGMELVHGVESDLKQSQEIVKETKSVFNDLNDRIVVRSMDIMKLARKKKRLEIWKDILINIYKRFHKYSVEINKLIDHCEYFDALNMIDKALSELNTLPKDSNMAAIKDIKRKFKNRRELIAQKTSQGVGNTIVSFNMSLYAKWLKTLKVKADEVNDFKMAGKKKIDKMQRLFDVSFNKLI